MLKRKELAEDCDSGDIEELAETQFVEFKENNVYINYL